MIVEKEYYTFSGDHQKTRHQVLKAFKRNEFDSLNELIIYK